MLITDQNGKRTTTVVYTPFGKVYEDDDNDEKDSYGLDSTTFKYTGQELDEETGLAYYVGRYYDPQLGRFLTPDSIVPDYTNPQAYNRYAYVLNNPIRYIDPTGHEWFDPALENDPDYNYKDDYDASKMWQDYEAWEEKWENKYYGKITNPSKVPILGSSWYRNGNLYHEVWNPDFTTSIYKDGQLIGTFDPKDLVGPGGGLKGLKGPARRAAEALAKANDEALKISTQAREVIDKAHDLTGKSRVAKFSIGFGHGLAETELHAPVQNFHDDFWYSAGKATAKLGKSIFNEFGR